MKVPTGHFDTSEQSPEEIAEVLTDRITRLMDAEGEAVPAPDEAKHLPGAHPQETHGSWARDVLDSLSDASVRIEQADFDGYDVEKAVGLPKVDREIEKRALSRNREKYDLPAMFLWDEEGDRSPNPDYYPAVEEHFDKVPFGLLPEFRDKVRVGQPQVSQQGTEKYVRLLDEAKDFEAPLMAWDPETDTYVIDDGYHRMVAMMAGGLNLFDVYVPKESPWARAMRGE